MRVKLTFSTELERVLDNLSDQINLAKKAIDDVPDILNTSCNLLKYDKDSGLAVTRLLNKSRIALNDADIVLSEVGIILSGYLSQVEQGRDEVLNNDQPDQKQEMSEEK